MPKSSFREILYKSSGVAKPILNGDGKNINTGNKVVRVKPEFDSVRAAIKSDIEDSYTKYSKFNGIKNTINSIGSIASEITGINEISKATKQLGKLATNANTIYRVVNRIASNPVRAPYNRRDSAWNQITDSIGENTTDTVSAVTDILGISGPNDPSTRRDLKSSGEYTKPYSYTFDIKDSVTEGNSSVLPIHPDLVDVTSIGELVGNTIKDIFFGSGGMKASDTSLQFVRNKIKDGLLLYTNRDLGNMALDCIDAQLAYTYKYPIKDNGVLSYDPSRKDYMNEYDPYDGEATFINPEEAMQVAIRKGFTSGYSDWRGYSLGTEHMWGMMIYKYNPKSIIPELPVIRFNTYSNYNDETGSIEHSLDTFDFGINPPVISYNLNFGTSREKEINMFNESKMMIPLGFSFQNYMSLDFADDINGSIKKWLAQYFNTICKPDERLMMPYIHAAYVIDLTIFKPGMKLMYRYQLICIPINYAFTHEGSGDPQGSIVRVEFSIIGLRLPKSSKDKDDPIIFVNPHTWKDIMLMPTEGVFSNNEIGDN